MEFSLIDFDDSYELISFEETLCMNNTRHAAHCCIYSPNPFPLFKSYECKAYVLVQMRYDGCLGFPGGYVSGRNVNSIDAQTIIDGLNRELVEETNLDKKYFVTKENYSFTYHYKENNGCFHFFTKEVSAEDFLEIERNSYKAEEFGNEVLGIMRVPLFTMIDGIRGFPSFLSNNFAGCCKHELVYFLLNKKVVSFDYMKESLSKSPA